MPPLSSSSSVFESSQSQSQQFSSVQQSSSSFSQSQSSQSTNQIYESQEFNGGVMKGYKMKEEFSSDQSGERNVRDSGIFTGINGDSNSLVDEEFDRKKHTVKDLAKHFALVKPKQNIPHNILPEQRIYNGDHGPALNYLGASEGVFSQSTVQGETDKILNKWDNHNTIARGWAGVQANYHPVTFRKMYNVDNQKQTAAL